MTPTPRCHHPRATGAIALPWLTLLAATGKIVVASTLLLGTSGTGAIALPPPEDTPEEILRTEIILEARSPVDGKPLTASEYVDLQAELADSENPPSVNTDTQQLIFLLHIRQFLNIVLPFPVF